MSLAEASVFVQHFEVPVQPFLDGTDTVEEFGALDMKREVALGV